MTRTSAPARLAKYGLIGLLALSPLGLGGCGTLVGAGVGGVAGNQIGSGKGKTAATIGGAAVGAVAGHAITGD
ncbi:glycine zipper 2TM domain-containing protein [Parvibaculum sp.]|uniref:glycine zipper 2TM domain-containing protein n=1 Tax=Parvibaculum sp. TaxID=2024848 RepID=UPI002BE3EA08|nr:glycine zipper 2TM domain-containing protein [Parvibaculum sp.]HUD50005.1 glycine zipper 2TM domain-containing protein [Parvibaculum sp.]